MNHHVFFILITFESEEIFSVFTALSDSIQNIFPTYGTTFCF